MADKKPKEETLAEQTERIREENAALRKAKHIPNQSGQGYGREPKKDEVPE